jgi:hypothetical protein
VSLDRLEDALFETKVGIAGVTSAILAELGFVAIELQSNTARAPGWNSYDYELLGTMSAAGLAAAGFSTWLNYRRMTNKLAEDIYRPGGHQDYSQQSDEGLSAHQAFGEVG